MVRDSLGSLARYIERIILSRYKMKKINNLFEVGLPLKMKPVLEYLLAGKRDSDVVAVARDAESRREGIASQGQKEIDIWYSPKPGSAGEDSNIDTRPESGNILNFTMERIAKTGKNQKWGTVLYLLARAFESTTVFELGSCAGISSIYLASPQSVTKLITVEGSRALAELARESLKLHECALVVNSSFDDAIDMELASCGLEIDLAFIDGHHEKTATIHYLNKMLPFLKRGGIVVFDDISWSQDMREAWDVISNRPEFSHTIDFGIIGICILRTESASQKLSPKRWDLRPIVGKPTIGDPHGWKETDSLLLCSSYIFPPLQLILFKVLAS